MPNKMSRSEKVVCTMFFVLLSSSYTWIRDSNRQIVKCEIDSGKSAFVNELSFIKRSYLDIWQTFLCKNLQTLVIHGI